MMYAYTIWPLVAALIGGWVFSLEKDAKISDVLHGAFYYGGAELAALYVAPML